MKDIYYNSTTASHDDTGSHDPISYYMLKFYPMMYFVWEVDRCNGIMFAIIASFVVEFISCVQITLPVPEIKILFSITMGCRLAPPTDTSTKYIIISRDYS